MAKIKVIATDVDGTLSFRTKRLDVPAYNAILKAEKAGLIVILTSGIPVQGLRPMAQLLGASHYLIGENGGVIFDGKEIEIMSNPETAKKCFEELKQKILGIDYYSKADTRLSEIAMKLGPDLDEVRKIAEKHGLRLVTTGFTMHLVQPGVNKGVALKRLLEKLGYKIEECAAIGDSENDVEMIREAGLGIAVGNAIPEAKEAAKYVTKKDHGAGVLEAVNYIIKLNKKPKSRK